MITEFIAALHSDVDFKTGFKRARHIKTGHKFNGSTLIEKLYSEKHPHTDEAYIFTVNIRECECGLVFFDNGLERRPPLIG